MSDTTETKAMGAIEAFCKGDTLVNRIDWHREFGISDAADAALRQAIAEATDQVLSLFDAIRSRLTA